MQGNGGNGGDQCCYVWLPMRRY